MRVDFRERPAAHARVKLLDLDPSFLRYEPRGRKIYYREVGTIAEAQGIKFLCPKCFKANRGPVGTHSVICWSRSRGVPDKAKPGPGRWKLDGSGFHDLTLNGDPGSRSVLLEGAGCGWHGFITNGKVTDA